MKTEEIIAISIASLIVFIVVFLIVRRVILAKKVRENSTLYKCLLELNERYNFALLRSTYKYTHRCNSKRQLDYFNFDKYFRQIVENNLSYFSELLQKCELNVKLKKDYNTDCQNLLNNYKGIEDDAKKYKVPYNFWSNYEETLFASARLNPVTEFVVEMHVTYTSPQGRNSYYNDAFFNEQNVQNCISEINRQKLLKLEREKYEQEKIAERERKKALRPIHEVERSKLTKKLRYEILERDGYKCVLCGRTVKDGAILHIDHITPISKGGKTIPENLRTLCSDCNLGKSDKLPSN